MLADHGGMLAAVPLVDVLQHFLAIAMREVDVDVRRFATFLAQEPLEQQFHLHRIDRRDAEAVADDGIGGRTTSLAQHARPSREAHDVPDDQEIAGEAELCDQSQLVGNLIAIALWQLMGPGAWGLGLGVLCFVHCALRYALSRSLHHQLSQVRIGRHARRQRKVRQRRLEVRQPERASLGDA
ncbi:MAG TPA: hypothetical protein VF128_08740 [Gemmatimonadaceae bacterium]